MLPQATYPRGGRDIQFFRQVLERLTAMPGVTAAGAVSILPESPNFDHTNARVVGRRYAPNEELIPDVYRVTPGYFAALRIPVRAGRAFSDSDDDQHPPVAIVNETMAKAMFSGDTALGRRIWTGAGSEERTIVASLPTSISTASTTRARCELYLPHADNGGGDLTLVVRSTGRASTSSLVRGVVRAVDPAIPVDDIMTMDDVLAASGSRRRLLANLSLTFAVGAIVLAAIGLYGIIAYSTAQRTQELGVRMALGATARTVVADVVGDALGLVAVGLGLGAVACWFLARLAAPLLFGVGH